MQNLTEVRKFTGENEESSGRGEILHYFYLHRRMVRVLVLGATGSIGSRAAIALAIAGHDVTALIRTESSTTKTLQQFGVRLAIGNITEVSSWENLFYSSKVIVLATNLKGSEVASIISLATNKPGLTREKKVIVYTSGVLVYGLTTNNKPVDEFAPTNPIPGVEWRVDVENQLLDSTLFERTIVLRPGFVYGHNHGYLEAFGAVAGGKVPVVIGLKFFSSVFLFILKNNI